MEKYYTPTIEEFRVGFEYEERYDSYNKVTGEYDISWSKEIYNLDHFLDVMYDGEYEFDTDMEYKRVKYLDQEDIESLGWKYDNNGEPYPEREPYELPISFDLDTQLEDGICYILYLYSDKTVWIEWIKDCAGMGYIFKGVIKNKSELKTVLKQLGIWKK
jgi:hypothetical protein